MENLFKLIMAVGMSLEISILTGWLWLATGFPYGYGMLLGLIAGLLLGIVVFWLYPREPKTEPAGNFAGDLALYKEGRMGIEEMVNRWSGRLPSKTGGAEALERKREEMERQRKDEEVARQLFGGIVPIIFKLGDWVRLPNGKLGEVRGVQHTHTEPLIHVAQNCPSMTQAYIQCNLERAFPRKGEWWLKRLCQKTHKDHSPGVWCDSPVQWQMDDNSPDVVEAVLCGCLGPVNYGEGLGNIGNQGINGYMPGDIGNQGINGYMPGDIGNQCTIGLMPGDIGNQCTIGLMPGDKGGETIRKPVFNAALGMWM